MPQQLIRPQPRSAAEPQLDALEDSAVVAVIAVAGDGRIEAANARLRKFLGAESIESLRSRQIAEFLLKPDDWAIWRDAAGPQQVAVALRSPAGTVQRLRGDLWVTGSGAGRRIHGVLVDDDDENLRAAAQHSARMEALGSLTAGVAHDFNNLLTVLVGNLYLVAEELRDQPKFFDKLKAARDAGKRGTELIKQLLAFARREELAVGVVDPAKVIENVSPLLRRALGTRITLEVACRADGAAVRASTAQLESVIVNLAVNARDAIDGAGRISIDVQRVQVQQADVGRLLLSRAGAYVAVRVADTGKGIAPDIIGRVFEPFFSTKTDRGGTGLGLSMVRWFAEQAGGAVQIDSVVGRGTKLTLLLPLLQDQVSDSGDKTMPLSILASGTERVVVLAPDEAVRTTIHQTLEVLGYRVALAAGVEDMLRLVAEQDAQLLMVDGLGRGDADVLIRARAARPDLRIVVATAAGRSPERFTDVAFLGKPFSLADLAGTVRRVLDGAAASPTTGPR